MTLRDLRPMLAVAGTPPSDYAEYAVEAKYDGQRGIAIVRGGSITLLSRNGADVTPTFPEVTAALPPAVSGRAVILDGEIVAPDTRGVPCFDRLQQRWPQNRRPTRDLLRRYPVQFLAFDVLSLDGEIITHAPYRERRALLAALGVDAASRVVKFPTNWTDCDPAVVLAATADLGLEGIVSKRLDSPYIPGRRSADWIKTPLRRRSEFVIGGWLPGEGVNRHTVGALLLGAHCPDGLLRFCGTVGSGVTAAQRRILAPQLAALDRDSTPFAGDLSAFEGSSVRWVRPVLIGDVEYREFTGVLRHPSWKGLRPDRQGSGSALLPAS